MSNNFEMIENSNIMRKTWCNSQFQKINSPKYFMTKNKGEPEHEYIQ